MTEAGVVTCGSSGMSFLLVSSCRLAVSGCWLVSGLHVPPVALIHDGPLGDAGGGGGRGEAGPQGVSGVPVAILDGT